VVTVLGRQVKRASTRCATVARLTASSAVLARLACLSGGSGVPFRDVGGNELAWPDAAFGGHGGQFVTQ